MKNQFALVFALFSTVALAQNTFPATGNVGVGTTTPIVNLDVLNSSISPSGILNIGFFGSRTTIKGATNTTGLYVQKRDILSVNPTTQMRIQSVSGQNLSKSYIDFESGTSTNTTRGALVFGHNELELMRINQNGKVRISNGANDLPTPDGYRLFVEEGILTEKLRVAVKTTANWADYVFTDTYKLMPLNEVEKFTKENKHLPNVPSAKKMVEEGLNVAEMDAKLLEKIEELTLYLIEQNKQIEKLIEQNKQIEELKTEIKSLKKQ